jgi:predicted permease
MSFVRQVTSGLRTLFRKDAVERDLDDELTHYLAESAAEKMREGLSREEAVRRARAELGSVTAVKEEVRGGGWEAAVQSWWQDLAYGARALRRNPGFTVVAVLTLALGIGANSAMFSVVNGVILRPLPYVNPGELVMLWTDDVRRGIHESTTGIPTINDWRSESALFKDVAIYRRNSAGITGPGDPERIMSLFAEPRLLPLLGVKPALGRTFTDAESERGELVAVISFALWQRRFGGGDVLDKAITIDGDLTAGKKDPRLVRVIGVMPRGFYFPDKMVDVWEPMRTYFRYERESGDRLNFSSYSAVGRLRPGVTADRAQAALTVVGKRLESIYPSPAKDFPGYAPNVVPALDEVTGRDLQRALWVLLGTVGFVLLIACVNVANLLLARGSVREREIAIRLAIGAGRGRILRQLLIESALLAVIAGALGLVVAEVGIRALVAAAPPGIPRLDELSIDGIVVLFTLGASMIAALVFGLAPAWRSSKTSPQESIKSEAGDATGARRVARLRGGLVVAECALAVVLLSGAGLLLRSFFHVQAIDPGFKPENVLVIRLNPSPSIGAGAGSEQLRFTAREAVFDETLARIRSLPGVLATGASGELMMSGEPDESITLDGEPYDANAHRNARLMSIGVSPGFFEVMGVPLRKGRFLTRDDALMKLQLLWTPMTPSYRGTAEAALVNETFVKQFLAGREPIGARFWMGHPGKPYWYEVVGVVGDMHRQGLEQDAVPEYFGSASGGGGDVVVRTRGNPLALAASVRSVIRGIDAGATIVRVSTAEDQLGSFSAQRRFQAWLLAIFAAVALTLAAIGIYGVMRYSVARRTREIGVRVALGASTGSIVRLVLSQGLALTGIGVAAGVAGSLALTGLLSHWLFGVTATDPVTFGIVVVVLLGVAALACWLPARRAAGVDPTTALRHE